MYLLLLLLLLLNQKQKSSKLKQRHYLVLVVSYMAFEWQPVDACHFIYYVHFLLYF